MSVFYNLKIFSASCSYPSGKEKLALAKEIVLLFPSLRISVPFGQNEGHVSMLLHVTYLTMSIQSAKMYFIQTLCFALIVIGTFL